MYESDDKMVSHPSHYHHVVHAALDRSFREERKN